MHTASQLLQGCCQLCCASAAQLGARQLKASRHQLSSVSALPAEKERAAPASSRPMQKLTESRSQSFWHMGTAVG